MADFKVGDLVKLKSGGPPMTVARTPIPPLQAKMTTNPKDYRCIWFSGKKQEAGWFPPESLEPAEPPPPK